MLQRCIGLIHVATASYIYIYLEIYSLDAFCCDFSFADQGVHQEVTYGENQLRTGEKDSRRND